MPVPLLSLRCPPIAMRPAHVLALARLVVLSGSPSGRYVDLVKSLPEDIAAETLSNALKLKYAATSAEEGRQFAVSCGQALLGEATFGADRVAALEIIACVRGQSVQKTNALFSPSPSRIAMRASPMRGRAPTLYHGHPCPSFWQGPDFTLGTAKCVPLREGERGGGIGRGWACSPWSRCYRLCYVGQCSAC